LTSCLYEIIDMKPKIYFYCRYMFGSGSASSEIRALGLIHALQAYSELLAKDSVGKSFDVMSVNPGGIDTALWEDRKVLEKKVTDEFISPEVLSDF
jgi:hypothetical protein